MDMDGLEWSVVGNEGWVLLGRVGAIHMHTRHIYTNTRPRPRRNRYYVLICIVLYPFSNVRIHLPLGVQVTMFRSPPPPAAHNSPRGVCVCATAICLP